MFGVLGANVWKPSQDKSPAGSDGTSGMTPPANITTITNTNYGTISTNNSTSSTESQKKPDWFACRNKYDSIFDICKVDYRISDTAFRSCTAKCSSDTFICESECQVASTCFENCDSELGSCAGGVHNVI